MARIDWTKFCNEIARANGIDLFEVVYEKHGEIKSGKASAKQIEMFARFGIKLINVRTI